MQKSQRMLALSVSLGITLLFLVSCRQSTPAQPGAVSEMNPPLGVPCAIEFRAPLPHTWTSLFLKGKLKAANDKWLVLTNEDKPKGDDIWLSRESVLLVVTGEAAKTYKGLSTP